MKKYTFTAIVFLTALIINSSAQAQGYLIDKKIADLKAAYPLPELTRAQMYADFDTLITIVKECNPQIGIIKKVTGYDIVDALQTLRAEIKEVQNITDYLKLLYKATNAVLEGHAAIGYSVWFYQYSYYREDIEYNKISDYDFSTTFKYVDTLRKTGPAGIRLCYSNGDYLLKYKTVFYQNSDSLILEQGTKITAINTIPIVAYLAKERNHNSGWDFSRKQFFTSRLVLPAGQNTLQFEQNNVINSVLFSSLKDENGIIYQRSFNAVKVKWIELDSVLFVRLPAMQMGYIFDLREAIMIYKTYPVKSVIVDIRGNSGGSDQAWMALLGYLTDTPVVSAISVLINDTERLRKRRFALRQPRKYDMIDTAHYFDVVEEVIDTIPIFSENIGYRDNIYVITDADIFSSAQVFASLATPESRIRTVGIPTGRIGGRGMTPRVFILPNSRFIFTLNITLDASNVQKPEDFYHEVLYPFYPSSNYYKYWYDKERPVEIDEKSMYQYDELFIETLNIIDEERAKK
jgi:hypothetical protein